MAKENVAHYSFNRGVVSAQALARVDLQRMRLSAETMENWLPLALGPMMLRPGWQYVRATYNNNKAIFIPFVFSMTQTALLECTNARLRPLVNEQPIVRESVSTTIQSGDFSSSSGWTAVSTGGGEATINGGVLFLRGLPIDSSIRYYQQVSVSSGDQNKEHGLRIVVVRGPVIFRAGTTLGGDDLIPMTRLDVGTHSLALTPTGSSFYVEFEAREARYVVVDSIQVEPAGEVTFSAPWAEADLPYIRWTQSGDVVFLAIYDKKPMRIERRAPRSWSLVEYRSDDGPFFAYPTDSNIRMSVSAALGNATITASKPFFRSNHVGGLIRVFTPGYNFGYILGQEDCFSPAVRVNGVGGARTVAIQVSGTWSGTLTVQKSFIDEISGFADTSFTTTSNTTINVTDSADNTAMWVRIGFKAGDYTSGQAVVALSFGEGSSISGGGGKTVSATSPGGRTGVARITAVTSPTQADIEILRPFSSSQASADWAEGEWSARYGWPSAVCIHESRLVWAGKDRLWGSVSDDYTSFDPDTEGDSGPLQRSIGFGPIQIINWLLPLPRLLIGTEAAEVMARSSTFEEPLTPTNFALKDISGYGSARISGVKSDTRGVFVNKTSDRVMESFFDLQMNDYITNDLTRLCPDLFRRNKVVKIAIQRHPDTRIHCVREDGTVGILVYEPLEEVRCWFPVSTNGFVEDVCVLPNANEDSVYYVVRRVINGNTVRYLEKWACEDECVAGEMNKQADSFVTYSGAATSTITGLNHLEGEEVVVWADGKDLSPDVNGQQTTYTVTSGQITLPEPVSKAVVGLPYQARFKSTKLAYAAQMGTALTRPKRLNQLGLILYKTHKKGLFHGRDFDNMSPLPDVIHGKTWGDDTVFETLDLQMQTTNGDWNTDSRLCLTAKAPRPVTVLAAVMEINTSG